MAAQLKASNVTQLKPRKARGSKSSGGRKPAKAAKPRAGAKVIPPQPTDADVRRDRQDRMLAIHHQLKATENKIVIAAEALSDLRTVKKQQRAALANIYPLELYDDARQDADRKTEKVDLAQRELTRAEIRDAFGLPAGPQAELDLERTPVAARPALHWFDVGFRACMDGLFSDPQGAGCPPENITDYTRGFAEATARIGAGIKGLEADNRAVADPAPPPLMTGEDPQKAAAKQAQRDAASAGPEQPGWPDWSAWDHDPATWPDEQKAAFIAWFDTLGDDEIDIVHPGAIVMFDQLCDGEDAGAGAEAEEVGATGGEPIAGAAPASVIYMLSSDEPFASGRQATYRDGQPLDAVIPGPEWPIYDAHPGDGFEASEEELQQQGGRRALQERRAAEGEAAAFSED